MKLGCSARPEEVALVKELGFDFVELPAKVVAAMPEAQFQALAEELRRLALPCSNFNAYCPPEIQMIGPERDPERNRAYARAVARRAQVLGVRCVCVGSPRSRTLPPGYDPAAAVDQLADFLADTAREFADAGAKPAFEALGTCYCNFFNRMEELPALMDRFPGGEIGLMADFYNMERSGEGDLSLEPYLPHILHVHISDDAGDPSKRDFFDPARFPIHRRRLLALAALGYDGTVSIEIDMPVRRAEAAQSLAFLREVFPR